MANGFEGVSDTKMSQDVDQKPVNGQNGLLEHKTEVDPKVFFGSDPVGKTVKCVAVVEEGESSEEIIHAPKEDNLQPVDDSCELKCDYLSIRPNGEVGMTDIQSQDVPNHQNCIQDQNDFEDIMCSIRETKASTASASQPYVTHTDNDVEEAENQTCEKVFDNTIDGDLQLDNEVYLHSNDKPEKVSEDTKDPSGSNDVVKIRHEDNESLDSDVDGGKMTVEVELKDPFNGHLYNKMQFCGLSGPLAGIAKEKSTVPKIDIKAGNEVDNRAGMMMEAFFIVLVRVTLEELLQEFLQKFLGIRILYMRKILEYFFKNKGGEIKEKLFGMIITLDLRHVLSPTAEFLVCPVSRKNSNDESRNPSQEDDGNQQDSSEDEDMMMQHDANGAAAADDDDYDETRVSDAVRIPATANGQGRNKKQARSISASVNDLHRAVDTVLRDQKEASEGIRSRDGNTISFANGDVNLSPPLSRKNGRNGDAHDPRAAVRHEGIIRNGDSHECLGGACAKGCHTSKNAEAENLLDKVKPKTHGNKSDVATIKKENEEMRKKLECKIEGCNKERNTTSLPCCCRHFCDTCYEAKLSEKPGCCPSCGKNLQFHVSGC